MSGVMIYSADRFLGNSIDEQMRKIKDECDEAGREYGKMLRAFVDGEDTDEVDVVKLKFAEECLDVAGAAVTLARILVGEKNLQLLAVGVMQKNAERGYYEAPGKE